MLTALISSIKGEPVSFQSLRAKIRELLHKCSKYSKQLMILDILLPKKAFFKETGNNNAAKDKFDGNHPLSR